MKYIILAVEVAGLIREFPIIFPNDLIHEDVSNVLQTIPQLAKAIPVSAGELPSMAFDGGCAGKSTTLNLKSREKDDDLMISMRDYNAGIRYA